MELPNETDKKVWITNASIHTFEGTEMELVMHVAELVASVVAEKLGEGREGGAVVPIQRMKNGEIHFLVNDSKTLKFKPLKPE